MHTFHICSWEFPAFLDVVPEGLLVARSRKDCAGTQARPFPWRLPSAMTLCLGSSWAPGERSKCWYTQSYVSQAAQDRDSHRPVNPCHRPCTPPWRSSRGRTTGTTQGTRRHET